MRIGRNAPTFIVNILILATLAACGGGGSSGSGGGLTFDGATTPAVVTGTNAEQLALDAYTGGTLSQSLVMPMSLGAGPGRELVPLAQILLDSARELPLAPAVAPLATQTESIPGSCGGSMTATVSDNGSQMSGSIVYSNYCEGGMSLNGSVTISASFNQSSGVVAMSMSFSSLSMVSAAESLTMAGSMQFTFDMMSAGAPTTIGMSFVMADEVNGISCQIKDYQVIITPGAGTDQATVSGTYYDYHAGYVIITTTAPLLVDSFSGVPQSGSLHFAGSNGTFADLTATGGGNYTINVSDGTVISGMF